MNKIEIDHLYVSSFSDNSLETIKKYGIGMEINHTCISEDLDDTEEKRKKLLSRIRNDVSTSDAKNLILHGPYTEIFPAAIDYQARKLAQKRLNQAYQVARSLNINRMVVHSGWVPFIYFKDWQSEKSALFWNKFMEGKSQDFRIYIENVLEDEPSMLADMMHRIGDPRIKLCLDIGHANAMTSANYHVRDWIRLLSPYIGHFHIHNNDGTEDSHQSLDRGSLDMTTIIQTIFDCCKNDFSITIEARDALPCLQWLEEKRYI